VPLTEAALARARELDDPLAEPLAHYLQEHVDEELGHDETLLGDLELIGIDRTTVLGRMPPPTVAGLVGSQYYWIHHYHPVALLGYIHQLECYPPSIAMIDQLQAGTGYERDAFRTMLAHAELDPAHGAELDELLDSLELTREQSAVVALSALHTIEMYTLAVEELLEAHEEAV
jgi:hypothetical protein